ncbi:hypothetical protein [Pinibacter soli]|uniref:Uncharacterized protein n=1 Tax=Pinibacter soli TaxID=3044211 RepID=A0ABT6RFT0_9BACT|nr:hypothetical protein [Pinibacter soli]MDI3320744.1 hypothetical protein [Pinibacter soli]
MSILNSIIPFLVYIAGVMISLYVGKRVFNWYNEVPKRNKYMEAQIDLLSKIAWKLGVPLEEIEETLKNADLLDAEKAS